MDLFYLWHLCSFSPPLYLLCICLSQSPPVWCIFVNFAPHCSYSLFCFQDGATNQYIKFFLQSKFDVIVPPKSSAALDWLRFERWSPWRQMRVIPSNCFIHPATLQVTQQVLLLWILMCLNLMSPLLIVAVVLHSSTYDIINVQPECNHMTLHWSEKQMEELMRDCQRSGDFSLIALALRSFYLTSRVQGISPLKIRHVFS